MSGLSHLDELEAEAIYIIGKWQQSAKNLLCFIPSEKTAQ